MSDRLKVLLQYLLPKQRLTTLRRSRSPERMAAR